MHYLILALLGFRLTLRMTRTKSVGRTLVGGSPLIKIIAKHVILSGENDTVCHFRSRTRP